MTTAERLHTWLFGLIYPAFLGTVLVGLFADGRPVPATSAQAWTLVLAAYFLVQFGEGLADKSGYDLKDAGFDSIELISMVIAFFHLGALSVNGTTGSDLWARIGVIIALILPPLKRWMLRRRIGIRGSLSALAVVATAFAPAPWDLAGFASLLVVYVLLLFIPARPTATAEPH